MKPFINGLGVLIIQMISTGIVILGIDQNYSQIIIGADLLPRSVAHKLPPDPL